MTPNHVKHTLKAGAPSQALLAAARRYGVIPGIHCASPAYANRRSAEGGKVVGITNDPRFLTGGAKAILDAVSA